MQKTKTYPISEVSRKVGLSQKRIREYEKEGLVKPERAPRTHNRTYSDADVRQIKRVKALIHQHGMTLACLRTLLVSVPCHRIFDCTEEDCPAYQSFQGPCYAMFEAESDQGLRGCRSCPVYLARDTEKIVLFERNP